MNKKIVYNILVKNWKIPEIGMTKEKILEFASFAEEGLNLGKQLSPECKTELKQLKAKYMLQGPRKKMGMERT